MKVSVIIPVYNVESYLEKCLNSVINQTYNDIEIILVNDGSTDQSLEIIIHKSKMDSRIIFVDKKNSGVSSARNEGIKMSTGELIAFLDADDWLEINFLEKMVRVYNETKADMIRCDAKKDYEGKFIKISTLLSEGFYNKTALNEKLYPQLVSGKDFDNSPICSCCFTLYKSNIIKEFNIYFDENAVRSEDLIFNIEYLLNVKSFYYLKNELLYVIRNVPSSEIKEKYLKECFSSYMYAHNRIKNIIDLNDPKINNIDNQFSNQVIFYALISLSNEISPCNDKKLAEKIRYIGEIINSNEVKHSFENLDNNTKIALKSLKVWLIKKNMPKMLYLSQLATKKIYIPIVRALKKGKFNG
jgi:glycosyltransferase involved in cell wall biosynthesis